MKTLTLAAVFILALVFGQVQAPLKNQDIIDLFKVGISADVILAKIRASPSEFDTSVAALQELKKAGVDNAVILAMVERSKQDGNTNTAQPAVVPYAPTPAPTKSAEIKYPPRGTYKHKKEITTEYDRFKDTTYVRLKYLNISTGLTERVSISVAYSYKGTVATIPETISLAFFSYSKEWRFLRDRNFIVIAGGERLDFGQIERISSDVGRGYVSEALAVSIPLEAFLKIVNASSVQVRLGYYELILAPDHYEALKDFASRIDPDNK